MRPTTKEEWIGYLRGQEGRQEDLARELKKRIEEDQPADRIEQAGIAVTDCAQRIARAKAKIAQYE